MERLKLLSILPVEGAFSTLRILRQMRDKLSFSEGELANWGIKDVVSADGLPRVTWDRSDETTFRFQPKATLIIVDTLKTLDAQGKLNLDLYSLAEKFLIGDLPEENVCDREEPEVKIADHGDDTEAA
jgi:hypothetical protein